MQHFFTENQWTETWNICWTIKAARNRWTQIHKYVTILCFQVTDKYIYSAHVYEIPPQKLFIWSLLYYLPVCCLIPVQLSPRPSRSMYFRDVPPTSFPGSVSCFEKEPDCSWSSGSQNLGAKNNRGEVEEIMVAMTKVTPSRPERSLPPLY